MNEKNEKVEKGEKNADKIDKSEKAEKSQQTSKFYVTPLIKCLFENISSTLDSIENFKSIIVETNFSVFAYINSDLDKSILELITDISYIFNGLYVSNITRKSIRRALKYGINYDSVSKKS
jgi:hypothetical protein